MSALTPEWLRIAADMIDAKQVNIGGLSSDGEVQAASFIFDEGVFYLGEDGMQSVKAMLLARYARDTLPLSNSIQSKRSSAVRS